ncbi:hypothetical protein ED312_02465 [Sinomicrobium pectinilyticum]|uniref:Uncharacterized protein n=1 Tax=Sinomicrobium pectinilyticum TaxID=1084421 RepID=A0A3N0F0B4_SINP1|nr:hypothetical protein ED312_02465 [Sinomicrobium pectinilyticum]
MLFDLDLYLKDIPERRLIDCHIQTKNYKIQTIRAGTLKKYPDRYRISTLYINTIQTQKYQTLKIRLLTPIEIKSTSIY